MYFYFSVYHSNTNGNIVGDNSFSGHIGDGGDFFESWLWKWRVCLLQFINRSVSIE